MPSNCKPEVEEKEEDMREKVCGICKKVKTIHKFDAFCNKCKSAANSIRRNNRSIF